MKGPENILSHFYFLFCNGITLAFHLFKLCSACLDCIDDFLSFTSTVVPICFVRGAEDHSPSGPAMALCWLGRKWKGIMYC